MNDERSGAGDPIHRHEQAAEPRWSASDPQLIEAIDAHITEHLGSPARVWHQIVSPHVHVDVHIVEPAESRPWYTLVTSGMSELPMAAPEGKEDCRFAELVIGLPPDWPLDDEASFRKERWYWPLRLLQDLAALPHEFDTWLWLGHTVPNGDPPAPYARGTKLCGVMLVPPLLVPDGFDTLRVGERQISFLAPLPLHADELQLKLDEGSDALVELLDQAELDEVVEADRPSVVGGGRRRRFGIF